MSDLTVKELRAKAREAFGGASWIASANKATLVQALESGEAPAESPALPNDGEALVALISKLGTSEDRVRAIVNEVLEDASSNGVDETAVRAIVEQAIREAGTVTIKVERPDAESRTVDGVQHPRFADLMRYLARGERVWVAGPTGSGKTTAVERIAEALDADLFVQSACTMQYDITGYTDANGSIHDSQMSSWARHPGNKMAILILDEVDGFGANAALAANVALANGAMVLPDGIRRLTKNHVVVATANTWGSGASAEYCGRNRMDAAFINRFPRKISWDYDDRFETALAWASFENAASDLDAGTRTKRKALAERMLDAARKARSFANDNRVKATISPRQMMTAAAAIADGDDFHVTWDEVIVGGLDTASAVALTNAAGV